MHISIKIWIDIFKDIDPDLEKEVPSAGKIIRLRCYLRFKLMRGWSDVEVAILDTGAYISLVPLDLWKNAGVELLGKYNLRGIVPKKNVRCRLI